jgi:hypothetical protein
VAKSGQICLKQFWGGDRTANRSDFANASPSLASALGANDGKAIIDAPETASIAKGCTTSRSILCIPGSGELDEAAAFALPQMLRRRGYGASAEKADALSMSKLFSLDLSKTVLVCICYIDRPSSAKIRYAVRRLTKKSADAVVVLAFLGEDSTSSTESIGDAIVVRGNFQARHRSDFRSGRFRPSIVPNGQ